jgi:hypothetical protein
MVLMEVMVKATEAELVLAKESRKNKFTVVA